MLPAAKQILGTLPMPSGPGFHFPQLPPGHRTHFLDTRSGRPPDYKEPVSPTDDEPLDGQSQVAFNMLQPIHKVEKRQA